ncbi:MAG: T9SS type A sorting domain-containing protein [Calditrichae bacterium]|nr:T9SS type A sorting domain-containing protein [Calditrichota bacterium]MCB9058943.1 T9SS type A sorting domain-containing protein [Calditrichia bacterium]
MYNNMSFYGMKLFVLFLFMIGFGQAQEIREYVVKKTLDAPVIDGKLDEAAWQNAALTESFVIYQTGAATQLNTQCKLLWDESYLYIGFICEDPDVWATLENRDDHLWNGEVVEILCDPDDDELNYFEVQVNPLGTLLDLFLNKAYYAGGTADLGLTFDSLKAGIWVEGTLNNQDDTDSLWQCEVALPFAEIAFMAPTLHFPPVDGEHWRILLTRYDYERSGDKTIEVSSWNQTDSRGFHVPSKFGKIIFSDSLIINSLNPGKSLNIVEDFKLFQNYPNPFNPSTTISYQLQKNQKINLSVYSNSGQIVKELYNGTQFAGLHNIIWDGNDNNGRKVSSGLYCIRLKTNNSVQSNKMILLK